MDGIYIGKNLAFLRKIEEEMNKTMNDIADRFFETYISLKKNRVIKSQTELAVILNTSKQSVSDIKYYRKKLTIENLVDLKKKHSDVNLEFIIIGKKK